MSGEFDNNSGSVMLKNPLSGDNVANGWDKTIVYINKTDEQDSSNTDPILTTSLEENRAPSSEEPMTHSVKTDDSHTNSVPSTPPPPKENNAIFSKGPIVYRSKTPDLDNHNTENNAENELTNTFIKLAEWLKKAIKQNTYNRLPFRQRLFWSRKKCDKLIAKRKESFNLLNDYLQQIHLIPLLVEINRLKQENYMKPFALSLQRFLMEIGGYFYIERYVEQNINMFNELLKILNNRDERYQLTRAQFLANIADEFKKLAQQVERTDKCNNGIRHKFSFDYTFIQKIARLFSKAKKFLQMFLFTSSEVRRSVIGFCLSYEQFSGRNIHRQLLEWSKCYQELITTSPSQLSSDTSINNTSSINNEEDTENDNHFNSKEILTGLYKQELPPTISIEDVQRYHMLYADVEKSRIERTIKKKQFKTEAIMPAKINEDLDSMQPSLLVNS